MLLDRIETRMEQMEQIGTLTGQIAEMETRMGRILDCVVRLENRLDNIAGNVAGGAAAGSWQSRHDGWNSFSEAIVSGIMLEIAASVARMPAICLETLCV